MSKIICGQPIRVMLDSSDGGDEKYIGQEGWVIESWDELESNEHTSEVILPNTDDADKSEHFFNYQLEFLPLLDIDKVRILTFYLITKDQANDDETICKATGLDTNDLDKYYSLAESICSQTKDMPNDGTIQSVLVNANKMITRFVSLKNWDCKIKTIGVQNPDPKQLPDVDISDDAWLGKK